jgi:hypothetical protein
MGISPDALRMIAEITQILQPTKNPISPRARGLRLHKPPTFVLEPFAQRTKRPRLDAPNVDGDAPTCIEIIRRAQADAS